ncbi:hypothetical protein V4V48_003790 [Vibrio mimicus]
MYFFSEHTKKLIKFSTPICLISLLSMSVSFIAMLFVAQVGKEELAAAALANVGYMVVMTFSTTSLYSISILVGATSGNMVQNHIIIRNGIWSALFLGLISSVILWWAPAILRLFRQDELLVSKTIDYFHFMSVSIIPILLTMIQSQYYIGVRRTNFSSYLSLIRIPFTLVLSYIFILGKYHAPRMGLAGVSFSVLIVESVFCLSLYGVRYIYFRRQVSTQECKTDFLSLDIIKKILKIGIPIGLQFSGELAAMTLALYMMGFFGVIALAASQIVSQYSMLMVMITLGLSQGVAVLVSESVENNDYHSVMRYRISAIKVILSLSLIFFMMFFFFSDWLITPFMKNPNELLMDLGSKLFTVVAFAMPIDAFRNIISGYFRGLKDSMTPMRVGLFSLWFISLPLSYCLAFGLRQGPVGLRVGFAIGILVASVMTWFKVIKKEQSDFSQEIVSKSVN